MPLHLLGKKSWNVYNPDNVERVRRDEVRAQAAEQEAERRAKDDDAAERLRLLRGGQLSDEETETLPTHEKKRKRDGDDSLQLRQDERRAKYPRKGKDARDKDERSIHANTTQEPLDQISNMRFRDAVGRHPDAQRPWYSTAGSSVEISEVGRDVWGNEDAGRQARNHKRTEANDPLLTMKKGVKQLREVERQKSEWREERERDLHEVEDLVRRERHRRRKEERHKHRRDKHRSHRDRHDRKHSQVTDKIKGSRGE